MRALIGWLVLALLVGAGLSGAAHASWPGNNGEIVSLNGSAAAGIGTITVYDPATRAVTTLVDSDGVMRRNVIWSPDGTRLVWVEGDVGSATDLRIRDADGTVRSLTNSGDVRTPNWTPDGHHIVFVCGTNVCIVKDDGTGLRTLITSDVVLWNDITLSPDGTRIAFTNGQGIQIAYLNDPSHGIAQVGILSGDACPGQFKIAWSPNSAYLAWCDDFHLQIVGGTNADTSAGVGYVQTLADDDYGNPTWSPDGETLVYPTAPSAPNGFHLQMIQRDGSDARPVLDAAGNPVTGDDPDWRTLTNVQVQPDPPSNASRPSISGDAVVGNSLAVDDGVWNGDPPLDYTYQWERCDTSGENCAAIADATANTYTVDAADAGATLRVVVTATNGAGTASSESDATGVIPTPPPPPPPAPVPNQAPLVRTATATLTGRTLRTTLTACDDSAGRLTATLTEWRLSHGKRVNTLRRAWSWKTTRGCHRTTHSWKTGRSAGKHYGTVRVRDVHGAWSKPVRVTVR